MSTRHIHSGLPLLPTPLPREVFLLENGRDKVQGVVSHERGAYQAEGTGYSKVLRPKWCAKARLVAMEQRGSV